MSISRYFIVSSCLLLATVASAADGTWKWNEGGTSIEEAFDWSAEANWEGGVKPSGEADRVTIPVPSGVHYIRMKDPVTVKQIDGMKATAPSGYEANRTVIVSEYPVTVVGGASPVGRGFELYADLIWPTKSGVGYSQWFSLCGDINDAAYCYFDTGIQQRLDRYANAAGEVRVNPGPTNTVSHSGGGYTFFGPQSMPTNVVGRWSRKAGSPFLTRVGAEHVLPAGTLVHGEGIPEGTFLRRVFAKTSIELSQPVSSDVADGEFDVTFDAFSPKVSQYLDQWKRNNDAINAGIKLNKFRAEDELTLTVGHLNNTTGSFFQFDTDTGFFPGTFVVQDAVTAYEFRLGACHIVLEGTATKEAGFPNGTTKMVGTSGIRAELTVNAGKAATIGNMTDVVGTLLKTGAGELSVALTNGVSRNTGALVAKEGRLTVVCPPDGESYVKTLAISNGATVKLTGDLRVDVLRVQPGARLAGPGRLILTGDFRPTFDVLCTEGATIAVSGSSDPLRFQPPVGAVVRSPEPAVWFDANAEGDFVFDGDGTSILRWKDHRGAGFEDVFATNVVKCPTRVIEEGKLPYVKIPNVGGVSNIVDMKLLVWSRKVTGIKAVFLATDPTDGGGVILGRTGRVTASEGGSGGPFYRASPLNIASPVVHDQYSRPNVYNGRFFLDGEAWIGGKQGYRGPCMQILECHLAGDGAPADAFGLSYVEKGAEAVYNGGQRLGECLVYTNELTSAQRLQIAKYLSKKWCGRDIGYYECDPTATADSLSASGGGLEVAADGTLAATEVVGEGTFVKSGDGTLYVKSIAAGGLHVRAGETIVRSFEIDKSVLPAENCWLHLDAADRSTFELNEVNGTNFVTRWNDCRGSGLYVRKPNKMGTAVPADSWIDPAAQNGLDCVDTGPLVRKNGVWANSNPARFLEIFDANGGNFASGGYYGNLAPAIKSCYFVFNGKGGGNALFGERGNNLYVYGFPTLVDYTKAEELMPVNIFNTTASHSQHNVVKNAIKKKAIETRLDGQAIDPFETPFPTTYSLFSYHAVAYGRQSQSLACAGFDNWSGGVAFGEVILYSEFLNEDQRNLVEAYLARKWFNRETPGYRPAEVGALTVDKDATLTLRGNGAISAGSLSGAGTVNGSVTLSRAGGFDVTETGGVPDKTVVNGILTLPETGVVTLLFNPAAVRQGTYAIAEATAVTGGVDGWTVAFPAGVRPERWDVSLSVVGNQVLMTIRRLGMVLIVK